MAMRWRLIVVGALLAVLLLIHITSLRHKELTTDEPLHYQYGYRVLHGTPRRTGAIDGNQIRGKNGTGLGKHLHGGESSSESP